jgi:hypothetical protein
MAEIEGDAQWIIGGCSARATLGLPLMHLLIHSFIHSFKNKMTFTEHACCMHVKVHCPTVHRVAQVQCPSTSAYVMLQTFYS